MAAPFVDTARITVRSGSGGSDDPCDLFQKFKFPVDEFFPPKYSDYIKENGGNCQNGSCKTGKRC